MKGLVGHAVIYLPRYVPPLILRLVMIHFCNWTINSFNTSLEGSFVCPRLSWLFDLPVLLLISCLFSCTHSSTSIWITHSHRVGHFDIARFFSVSQSLHRLFTHFHRSSFGTRVEELAPYRNSGCSILLQHVASKNYLTQPAKYLCHWYFAHSHNSIDIILCTSLLILISTQDYIIGGDAQLQLYLISDS